MGFIWAYLPIVADQIAYQWNTFLTYGFIKLKIGLGSLLYNLCAKPINIEGGVRMYRW